MERWTTRSEQAENQSEGVGVGPSLVIAAPWLRNGNESRTVGE